MRRLARWDVARALVGQLLFQGRSTQRTSFSARRMVEAPVERGREAGLIANRPLGRRIAGVCVSERIVETDGSGRLAHERVATGNRHTFVVRRLVLDHQYHDEDPVQGADFSTTFANGLVVSGKLDAKARPRSSACPLEVRFGAAPDQQAFERVDSTTPSCNRFRGRCCSSTSKHAATWACRHRANRIRMHLHVGAMSRERTERLEPATTSDGPAN
jgi:hypothetical protein